MGSQKGGFQWENWNLKTGYKTNQWRSTIAAPLCAFCNKNVFPAERVIAAGQKFHKFCLKCITCNTLLNPGNVNEHEKKVYCTSCYRRQFGPRKVNPVLGISASLNLESPPQSPNLNNNFHYRRLTSTDSSTSHTSSDDDNSRFSHVHANSLIFESNIIQQQMKQLSSSVNLTPFKMTLISKNICPRCSKNVYQAEGIKAAGKSFHKQCYTCAHCKGSISVGRYAEHNGELYDNNCYQRLFSPRGIFLTGN